MKKTSNLLVLVGLLAFLLGSGLVISVLQRERRDSAPPPASAAVLVARQAIPAGTAADEAVAAGTIVRREVDDDARPATALASLSELSGRTIDVDVAAGEPLVTSHLRPLTLRAGAIEIPPGKQGVAVQLGFVAGGAGYVGRGDFVNLYGNVVPSEAEGTVTKLVLGNIEVLDVSSEIAPRRDIGDERPTGSALTYLLALTPEEAERVIFLSANGELWVALAGDEAAPLPATPGRRAADVLQ
ncbi:MAG TPA: Flp pilus assembly protein CpaB [Acidimicrobiales bacterium]|nr:Flp pilus assembly protein CpaB [Acidimicrobiales bacterium]